MAAAGDSAAHMAIEKKPTKNVELARDYHYDVSESL